MTRRRSPAFLSALSLLVGLALAGCDRGASSRIDSAPNTDSTVQPTPATASSSTLPVSPSGLSNPSTTDAGNGLSNLPGDTKGSNGSRRGGGKS